MRRRLLGVLFNVIILIVPTMIDAADIPSIKLSVTVRQKEDGKLSKGLHLLELFCFQGECSLTSLSLNQCGSGPKAAFYPKIERTSTREGNLIVSIHKDIIDLQEKGVNIGGKYVTNFKIGYKRMQEGSPHAVATSLSGGYIKDSDILGKIYTVEFVPLNKEFQEIQLDCPVLLPGIAKLN